MMKSKTPPDSSSIRQMFDHLATRYNLFNLLMSLGLAGLWRNRALANLKPGMNVLDLGCGTGDLAFGAYKKYPNACRITGLDFSESMLGVARARCQKLQAGSRQDIKFILGKAESLPIERTPYDFVVSGFVLRSLYENIDSILNGVYRSLADGGQVSLLDITEPPNRWIKKLWQLYMNTLVAFYGRVLFGRNYPAFYLTQSAERFLKAPEFAQKLKEVGFKDVKVKSFMFGVISLYQAKK